MDVLVEVSLSILEVVVEIDWLVRQERGSDKGGD